MFPCPRTQVSPAGLSLAKGLISRSRVATARYSHLEAKPLREATEYMERYKQFWNTSFDRLDAALATFQKEAND